MNEFIERLFVSVITLAIAIFIATFIGIILRIVINKFFPRYNRKLQLEEKNEN